MTASTGRSRQVKHTGQGYLDATHRPLNALVFVAIALAFSYIGSALAGSQINPASRADILRVLNHFRITVWFLAPLTIVAVLIAQHVARKDPWKLRLGVLAGMIGEGIFWTLPLIAIGILRGQLAAANGGSTFHPGLEWLCADVAAAVYEEFLFRLVLINLALLIAVDIFGLKEQYILPVAVIAGALLFAWYHPESSADWGRMITHSLEGLLWGTLMIYRGFGISLLSHISWNLFVHLFYAINQ